MRYVGKRVGTGASPVEAEHISTAPSSAYGMRAKLLVVWIVVLLCSACTPRDLLTRRLATDLISASDAFKAPQQFVLETGIVSNKDYASSEYLLLQHHGWISANTIACTPALAPPPCWEIMLTPSGVETVHAFVSSEQAARPAISIPVARRSLIAVTGISKQGNVADVEFTWRWVPMNEIGDALYSSELHYRSVVAFRDFDDGWRLVQSAPHSGQTLDEALKNSEPAP